MIVIIAVLVQEENSYLKNINGGKYNKGRYENVY